MSLNVSVPCRSASLEATIIRADGSVEHLGVIAYYHRNPLYRALYRLSRWFRK